jgi:hypothetical protein
MMFFLQKIVMMLQLIIEIEFLVMMLLIKKETLLRVLMCLNICAISDAIKMMGILRIEDRILCIWRKDNEKGVLQIGV